MMTRDGNVDVVTAMAFDKYIVDACNSLSLAVSLIQNVEGFENTTSGIKEIIGDLYCTHRTIDQAIKDSIDDYDS